MVELLPAVARLTAALLLVALNGFFVAAEFALVRVRSTAVDQLVAEGRAGARTLRDALDQLDDYLAATQLGITIASLALGWVGEPAVAALIEPVLGTFFSGRTVHAIAVGIGFSVITFFHVVYGELAAKTISIAAPERMAILVAPPMKLFYYVFKPALVVLNGTANWSTSLFGIPPASETDETLSEEELRRSLTVAQNRGKVDANEVEMVERVFDLDDTTVRGIMRPWPDVTSVPASTSLPELRTRAVEGQYTRYPVVDDEEQVVGLVDVKDVLRTSDATDDEAGITAADLTREVLRVPESITLDDLLAAFQDEHRQMAVVLDEWGAVEGLVTVEDVVEEIVGDLRDQFDLDEPDPSVERLDDGTLAADGAVPLETVNERLDATFEADAYETVGGFVLGLLGRAPAVGDTAEAEGYRFRVTDVDGARVMSVRIGGLDDADVSTGDGDGGGS